MRRLLVVLAGLVIAGCAPSAAPRATVPPGAARPAVPPPEEPTGRAAARASVERANGLLGLDEPGRREDILHTLEEAVRQYLQDVGDLALLARDVHRQADLAEVLTLVSSDRPASRPTVQVRPFGGVPVLLVAYGEPPRVLGGVPLLAFHGAGPSLQAQRLAGAGAMRVEEVVDVTGGGRDELVLTDTIAGGDGFRTMFGIFGWHGDRFAPLFEGWVGDRGGLAGWRLVPRAAGQDVVQYCPAFGPFDHQLREHPTLTRTYRWDGAGFAVVQATLPPPMTRHDAFNRAEVAFRAGALAAAIDGYRTVIEDQGLRAEPSAKPDWPALAWLRTGQAQALLGDPHGAQASLERAGQAGGAVGVLAGAFRDALAQPDGVVRGFVATEQALRGRLGPGTVADHFGVEIVEPGLLLLGLALGAHLEAHPDHATASAAQLRGALEELGLHVSELAKADLDGDGQEDLVALVPTGDGPSGWIVTRRGGHWRSLLARYPHVGQVRLGAVEPLPDGPGHVVALLGADGQPRPVGFIGLRDGRPRLYDAERRPVPVDGPTSAGQCDMAEGLGNP